MDYDEIWNELYTCITKGEVVAAKRIFDKVAEDAWKYNDLKD